MHPSESTAAGPIAAGGIMTLTMARIERYRREHGRAALLYLTDRCPVGCAHCSVDARPEGPGITDWALFGHVVDVLCDTPGFELVGISGGEPFVERRGLSLAARRLADTGKLLVPYTSGRWGGAREAPEWIRDVLRRAGCVVLSTDAHHAARVPDAAFVGAARAIAREGTWIGCQVLDGAGQRDAAERLLARALGPEWDSYAEITLVPLLPYGRAARSARPRPAVPGAALGRCGLAATPVVRYDGRISACCNELVVGGGGPPHLRRAAGDPSGLRRALAELADDPFRAAVGSVGLGALTGLPAYRDLADEPCSGICDLCWRMLRRGAPGPAVRALASLAAPGAAGRPS